MVCLKRMVRRSQNSPHLIKPAAGAAEGQHLSKYNHFFVSPHEICLINSFAPLNEITLWGKLFSNCNKPNLNRTDITILLFQSLRHKKMVKK